MQVQCTKRQREKSDQPEITVHLVTYIWMNWLTHGRPV